MKIAVEEIFGPVLVIIGYDTLDEAIAYANDTDYGLAGYVFSGDLERARKVASQIRAGYITINHADLDLTVPFGGYKMSGNGREFGAYAFDDFLELKSIVGYANPKMSDKVGQKLGIWYVNNVMKIPFSPPGS